jgi:hypothetical protein
MEEYKKKLLDYLDEIINFSSSRLVGKIMKRFDILDDRELLRRELKELVYEEYRSMKEIFKSYGDGIEMSFFHFTKAKNIKQ